MAEVEVSSVARADLLDIHTQSVVRFGLAVADKYIDGITAALGASPNLPSPARSIRACARQCDFSPASVITSCTSMMASTSG